MAKSNTSSKYNRYQKQDDKATINNKNKSKSTKGIKDTNDTKDTKNTNTSKNKDLDATTNLDISFIDGKNKKKPVLEKTEIRCFITLQ